MGNRWAPRALRPYLPNSSHKLALVSLDDLRPFRAMWPVRFTQVVGGRRWSLSLIRYSTPKPQLINQELNTIAEIAALPPQSVILRPDGRALQLRTFAESWATKENLIWLEVGQSDDAWASYELGRFGFPFTLVHCGAEIQEHPNG